MFRRYQPRHRALNIIYIPDAGFWMRTVGRWAR